MGLIQNDLVHFTGEQTPQQVAEWMYNADALVLSSRYETYGVVLAEAAAAGLPILSTPVGIAQELANLIVPQEIAQNKPGRFAEFIETILWSKDQKPKSNDTVNRFSAQTIGAKLKSIYDSSLHNNL
jgi:glycosyltransferase involved in cell wall biosynthesis